MNKQYVFIDDSGDPGMKKSSTNYFIISAILLYSDHEKQSLSTAIDQFRKALGWRDSDEFKFNTTNKKIILKLIDHIKHFDFCAYAIVLDKTKIKPKDMPKDRSSLYYYVIKELLLKLNLTNPIITIDGRAGKQYANEIRTYLRQNLRKQGAKQSRIFLTDSRKNSLIQLADIVVGAVARSYRKDKTDTKTYIKALKNKIIQTYKIIP